MKKPLKTAKTMAGKTSIYQTKMQVCNVLGYEDDTITIFMSGN